MTICNCCPCCCLWGTLPNFSPKISRKIQKLPGVTVTVTDLCSGCGTCTEGVCFVGAIELTNGRAEIMDTCRGCGRCVEICPDGAINLTIDETTVFQKTVKSLSRLVDVT